MVWLENPVISIVPLPAFNVPLLLIAPLIWRVELVTVNVAAFCIIKLSILAMPESITGKILPVNRVVGINVISVPSGTPPSQLPGVNQFEVPAAPVHFLIGI